MINLYKRLIYFLKTRKNKNIYFNLNINYFLINFFNLLFSYLCYYILILIKNSSFYIKKLNN